MMHRSRFGPRHLAAALAVLLVLMLAAAQTVALTAAQIVAPTPTPAATPGPTPEPTETIVQLGDALIKGETPLATVSQIISRYRWWGLSIIALFLLVILGFRYINGLGSSAEDLGKTHGGKLLALLERSGIVKPIDRYLNALTKRCATIKPLGIEGAHVTLDVARVHVPLRFTELSVPGEASKTEPRLRRSGIFEQIERLERDEPIVFTLLSDPALLPRIRQPTLFRRMLGRIRGKKPNRQTTFPFVRDEDTARIPATSCLLLLGDAGSGKTTTLRYAALRLIEAYRQHRPKLLRSADMRLYLAEAPLPIYARLTEFARWLQALNSATPSTELFLKWLDETVSKECDGAAPTLSRFVQDGKAMLLLDGLDEAGDEMQRASLAGMIARLADQYKTNRYLIASRPAGYGGQVQLPGFSVAKLSGLNAQEAVQLLENWFMAVKDPSPGSQSTNLWGKIQLNPRLVDMAANPLLLTVMAVLHYKETELPNERAALYEKLIDLLLGLWRAHQLDSPISYNDWNIDRLRDERPTIEDLAFRMQQRPSQKSEQAADVELAQAQEWLYKRYTPGLHPDAARRRVAELLSVLELQCGLLRQLESGAYTFTHYSFQEYLAACSLRALDKEKPESDVAFLLNHAHESRWRETLLLAVGHWSLGRDRDKAERLIRALLERADTNALLLAGAALADIRGDKKLPQLRDQVAMSLSLLAFDPLRCPEPTLRNQAAGLLDRLSADVRPELDLASDEYWAAPLEPGAFRMGDATSPFEDERSEFDYTIEYTFQLARFPVTNAQYLQFLNSLQDEQVFKRHRPAYWPGRRFHVGEGSHPVVGVSWYSAMAFAAWAEEWLRKQGRLRPGEQVRLPTEPEWERAAAYPPILPGGTPQSGRRAYPCGGWPDLTEITDGSISAGIPANTRESGIGGTSVVGIFPHGQAVCGAQDMAGNVWEWCCTQYKNYPLPNELAPETIDKSEGQRTFVLRGGSWNNGHSFARCACRLNYDPYNTYDTYGLRLARLFSLGRF